MAYLIDGFKRGNLMFLLTEVLDKRFTPEQIEVIKQWGDLEGEWKELGASGTFIGSGTRGHAFKFGDKILKVTNDVSEAQACVKIIGEDHPNIYKVFAVGETTPISVTEKVSIPFYLIVESFLPLPTQDMLDVGQYVLYKVDRRRGINPKKIYYQWKPEYLNLAKSLMEKLLMRAVEDPTFLQIEQKNLHTAGKLQILMEKMKLTPEEAEVLNQFYNVSENSSNSLNSLEDKTLPADPPFYKEERHLLGLESYVNSLLSGQEIEHLHDLGMTLTWLKEKGIIFYDLTAGNIRSKNSKIAIIDIGYSHIENPEQLPLLKLDERNSQLQKIMRSTKMSKLTKDELKRLVRKANKDLFSEG